MPNKQRMTSWGVIAAPQQNREREGKKTHTLTKLSYLNPVEEGTTHIHTHRG